jgi:antibiotic biosynthesis monooxygenase (ABM) superfamily enzyme
VVISVGGSTVKPDLSPEMEAEEERMVAELDVLVRSMPGFISMKDSAAEDGEWITVLRFETEEDLRRFREYHHADWVRTDGDLQWLFVS